MAQQPANPKRVFVAGRLLETSLILRYPRNKNERDAAQVRIPNLIFNPATGPNQAYLPWFGNTVVAITVLREARLGFGFGFTFEFRLGPSRVGDGCGVVLRTG